MTKNGLSFEQGPDNGKMQCKMSFYLCKLKLQRMFLEVFMARDFKKSKDQKSKNKSYIKK